MEEKQISQNKASKSSKILAGIVIALMLCICTILVLLLIYGSKLIYYI